MHGKDYQKTIAYFQFQNEKEANRWTKPMVPGPYIDDKLVLLRQIHVYSKG